MNGFADKLLDGLNPEQREVVLHDKGPLLAVAVAGAGKCVTGDSLVATPDGVRRIDQCQGLDRVSHSIDTGSLKRADAEAIWLDMGESPVMRVTTKLGYSLRATHEHPLLVWRDGVAEWVRCDRLCVGDRLMLLPGYGIGVGRRSVCSDEAYVIGLLMGDGSASPNTIQFHRGGDLLPPVFFRLIRALYGIESDQIKMSRKPEPSQSVTHRILSPKMAERMRELDVCLENAKVKCVPDWLVAATVEERVAFLRGYFDTDGYCGDHDIEAVSASARLAQQVHQMLLGLGIISRLKPKRVGGYDHVYWRINISGLAARRFSDAVGFAHETSKKNALAKLVEHDSNTNVEVYGGVNRLLKDLLPEWKRAGRWDGGNQSLDGVRIADYLHGRRRPSAQRILQMTEGVECPTASVLRQLASYFLDAVKSVEADGDAHVYDFHVPVNHSFLANGIVSHNTHALVNRVGYLVKVRGVDPARILAVTFSRDGAREMQERLDRIIGKSDARIGTFHSLGLEILKAENPEFGQWEIDDKGKYRICLKDAVGYRGMNWADADVTALESYVGLCKADLARPDSDVALDIAKAIYARTRKPGHIPQRMREAYARAEDIRRERRILTFDDMMMESVELLRDNEESRARWAGHYDYVLQDEAQDQNLSQLLMGELLAQSHRNYMLVGDPAQCHPPGVMIQRESGVETPIELLQDGDRVRGWNRNAQRMIGGRRIRVAKRDYSGTVHTIEVGDRRVPMTSNHKVLARWTDRGSNACVTYLMHRRGYGYRVGWCKLFAGRGEGIRSFHLAIRAKLEKADSAWILGVHESRTDASVHESVIAAAYGIPTATFEPVNGTPHQTAEAIARIFGDKRVANKNLGAGAQCLADHDLHSELPIWPCPTTESDDPAASYRRGTHFAVYAANVIPGLMSLPLPDAVNAWASVSLHMRALYAGPVYSLDVEADHSYSANGVVVLNCIYTWRGAKPEKLLKFEQSWGARVVLMGRNYRCGQSIIDTANRVLDSMDPNTRLDVKMICERTTGDGSKVQGLIQCREYSNLDDEGFGIVDRINELLSDGEEPRSIAVLYRTNAQSRSPEEALISARIPYRIVGGVSFYERKEVKALLAYLRLAAGTGNLDDIGKCINTPFRFLGKAFVDKVREEAERSNAIRNRNWGELIRSVASRAGIQSRQRQSAEDWAELIGEMSDRIDRGKTATHGTVNAQLAAPARILEDIIRDTRYVEALEKDEGEESTENSRVSNVREMVRAAGRFTTVKELLDYVDKTLLASKRQSKEKHPNKVTLSSLHRSKGLEWKHVFLIGASDKILPHGRAEEPEEERRLFYVGVTRARDFLHVSCVRNVAFGSKIVPVEPSPFLTESGLQPVNAMGTTSDDEEGEITGED